MDLKSPGTADWYTPEKGVPFTFLPSYKPDIPRKVVENFTFIAYGNYGSNIITEPSDYAPTQAIKWDAKFIRFHYPSEHSIANKSFNLEMQIYHQVLNAN